MPNGSVALRNLGVLAEEPPSWLPGAVYQTPSQAIIDPYERAALRQRMTVRPPLGRQEGELTRTIGELVVPQTPLDVAALFALGPGGRVATKAGALALGGLLTPTEAQAGPVAALLRIGRRAPAGGGVYPGIYKRPDVIASEAAAQVAPEHPALKTLFGVTRQDLYDIGQQGRRTGNIDPTTLLNMPARSRGSYVSEGVATDANAGRLVDALGEAEKRAPLLIPGMDAWYVMDPAYQRQVQLIGPDAARREYVRLNTFTSMASPMSEVLDEINRGTAAYMMATRGQFPTFAQYGGMKEALRGSDFPAALRDVGGHMAHSTAHAGPMRRYLESGVVDMTQPKVPLYIGASGVPETGFQTTLAVPDAHFMRAIGAADVRAASGRATGIGASAKTPEYLGIGPWFREEVAEPLGIQAVPAQGRLWGLMAPQTGVESPIGAPKLELLAQRIWERAQKLGVPPDVLRDQVLTGKEHASWLIPAAGVPLLLGGAAEQE